MALFGGGKLFDFMPDLQTGFQPFDTAGPLGAGINQTLAQLPPKAGGGGFFGKAGPGKITLWDILGGIGDGLSGQQIYGGARERRYAMDRDDQQYQQRRGDALEDYGVKKEIDQRFAEPSELPSLMRESKIYQSLTPEEQAQYRNFLSFRQPVQPMIMGQYDTVEEPQQETTIVNPKTGERMRLNPQSGQWEPVGGAGPGQPGFPVR